MAYLDYPGLARFKDKIQALLNLKADNTRVAADKQELQAAIDTKINISDAENIVMVQDEQPTAEYNEIWIKESPQTPIQVPTYTEFQNLVKVQSSQPAEEENKIWIQEESEDTIVVPTYEDVEVELAKKINKPVGGNGTAGQILRTNGTGGTSWENAATSAEISAATETWLEDNITNPSNPPLDRSLSLENAAAPADMVGDLKSAIGQVGEVTVFHPTNQYSNLYDYNITTGMAYIFENNGSSLVTISSNDGNNMVEKFGSVAPTKILSIVATANAPKLNCYLSSADNTASISVYKGIIGKIAKKEDEHFNESLIFLITVDEDIVLFTRFTQGSYSTPGKNNRICTERILIQPGDTIYASEIDGFQHKIYSFINKTTTYVLDETPFNTSSEFTNNREYPVYVVINAKLTNEAPVSPSDIVGIKLSISSNTTLSDTKHAGMIDADTFDIASKINRREFLSIDTTIEGVAYEFALTIGNIYRFHNKGAGNISLTTRETISSSKLETIGTLTPGSILDFTPSSAAGAIYVYGEPHDLIVYYGDGLITSSIEQLRKAVSEMSGDIETGLVQVNSEVDKINNELMHLGDAKEFRPTTAYSTKFDYSFVAGKAYLFKNNGSILCTLSTNDGSNKIENIGSVYPGKTLSFVATENAPKLNCYLSSADSTGSIVVYGGQIADGEAVAKETLNKLPKFLVSVDEDVSFFVDIMQGAYTTPDRTDRVCSTRIMLNPGDTISVSEIPDIQHKLFVFKNKTTTFAVTETSFLSNSTFTNAYDFPVYVVVQAKRQNDGIIVPLDLLGIKIEIASYVALSSAKRKIRDISNTISLASKIHRTEFSNSASSTYEFTFEAGECYIFSNEGPNSVTLYTRQTVDSNNLETIGTIAPGDTLDFIPAVSANALRVYLEISRFVLAVYYGDGIVSTNLKRMSDTIVGLDEKVDRVSDQAVKINSNNQYNPYLPLIGGKCYNSGGEMEDAFYWSIAPLINVSNHHGHTIMCNKWIVTTNRYMCFIDADGVKTPVLITNEPITIPNDAVYASIPMNRGSGNDYDFEDAYIWFDIRHGGYVPYSQIGAYVPIRTFYTVPDHVKGCLDNDSPFRLDSNTKLNDVYYFYDRMWRTFSTVMEREQIATSSTPTGDYALEDSNTYPIYAYHIYPTIAPRDTDNVIAVCSCIHGDSYPNGATVPNDVFEHVAALAYVIEDLLFNPENNDITKFIREQCHLVVIPVVNPWGCQNGHRWNGRGVDLNRQFPDNFIPNLVEYDNCSSGAEALSENESKGMYDFLIALNAEHPIKFFIDFQSRGGAYGIGSNDNRYLPIFHSENREMKDIMKRVGDTLVQRFGGVYQMEFVNPKGQLSAWVCDTMNIASFTCETFGAPTADVYHRGHSYHLKNSVAYFGETLDVFTRHYIMGWNKII